jgi:transcriptional regulator with XRE-family HTH domain
VTFAQLRRHDVRVPDNPEPMTELGALVEAARKQAGISKREAARRAGISEGRWRQIVTGIQKAGEVDIPVNPRRTTVEAMARAVGVNPDRAIVAAGFEPARRPQPDEAEIDKTPLDPDVVAILRKLADPNVSNEQKFLIKEMLRSLAAMPAPEPPAVEQKPSRRRAQ